MQKVLTKASVALTLAMLGAVAHAECSKYECNNVRVVAMYTQANGDALVQLSGKPWQLACKPTRYVYVTLPLSTDNFQNLYAHLAAYQIMEQPISVRIDIDAKSCTLESFEKAEQ